MNEQELIKLWNSQDISLEESIKVNKDLLTSVSLQKIKSYLTVFRRTNIFELIVNVLFLHWLIQIIPNHLDSIAFLLAAGFLSVLMVGSIIFNSYNLYLAKSIAYNSSIVETQQKIERIKLLERYDIQSLYILIPTFSVAFLVVVTKAVTGLDLHLILGIHLLYYTIGSFIVGLIIVWFLKRFPDEQLQKAHEFLKEIKELE
ncbi:MAG: hypothetical protein AB8G11_05560 [Saprospiraceae bacterium]